MTKGLTNLIYPTGWQEKPVEEQTGISWDSSDNSTFVVVFVEKEFDRNIFQPICMRG